MFDADAEPVAENEIDVAGAAAGEDSAGSDTERALAAVALKVSGVTTSMKAQAGMLVPGGTFTGQLLESRNQQLKLEEEMS